jgi:hypothetical protein
MSTQITIDEKNRVLGLLDDDAILLQTQKKLVQAKPDGELRILSDLSWVMPCAGISCQLYEAGTSHQIVTGAHRRILFVTNGSRFPVTDAAGIFPYFRIAVFDLDSGAEIYRKEYVTKTGKRAAEISPDGDLLAISDGDVVSLYSLKDVVTKNSVVLTPTKTLNL